MCYNVIIIVDTQLTYVSPISYSSTSTSFSHNNIKESEAVGSRPIGWVYNLPTNSNEVRLVVHIIFFINYCAGDGQK